MEIVTSDEMKRIDRHAIRSMKIPSLDLMERAGGGVVEAMVARCGSPAGRAILVLCGKGNNGGDGLVVARLLRSMGCDPLALLVAEPGSLAGDAAANLAKARAAGVRIETAATPRAWRSFRRRLGTFELFVDALLGTGLSGPAGGLTGQVISDLDRHRDACRREATRPRAGLDTALPSPAPGDPAGPARQASAVRRSAWAARGVPFVLAVDLPSGLSGDSAAIPGPAVHADLTVALCRPKLAHLLPPACLLAGEVTIADIGIPGEAVATVKPRTFTIEPRDLAGVVPPRARDAHKGSFGHALIVGGGVGKAGAPALAARAALRAGAGLVTAAAPASVRAEVASFTAEVMTCPIEHAAPRQTAARLLAESEGKSALAVGPGLGREEAVAEWIRALVLANRLPIVLDADGLNAFEGQAGRLARARGPLVLTPHPGEAARLLGTTTDRILADRVAAAVSLVRATRAIVVLKGMATLVASPDGRLFVNTTGNPGMATGGTGDVLTGILAGLLAQRLDPLQAALLGVWAHGRSGDLAAASIGEQALMAGDLIDHLPLALREPGL